MTTYKEIPLSASTNGKGILINATESPGDSVHTAIADQLDDKYDKIYLYATNKHTEIVSLTLEYGDQTIVQQIPKTDGLEIVLPGLYLRNAETIKIYASVTDVVTVFGSVGRTEPDA